MDRRNFLKVMGAGGGTAALAPFGSHLPPTAFTDAAVNSLAAHAAITGFIADPPFSFVYGAEVSATLLQQWPAVRHVVGAVPGRFEETVTWRDPAGGLEVRAVVVVYEAYGAFEWTVTFANTSSRRSAQLSEVLAADTIINGSPTAPYVLHHFNGSSQQADDYGPLISQLTPGKAQLLFPFGGRPSSFTWPYFNVDWGGEGAMVAVGWPGQWTVQLLVNEQEGLRLQAGMTSAAPGRPSYDDISGAQLLDTSLEAGETVRTPLIAIMPWSAPNWQLAQNQWRRWMAEYNMPRFGGSLPEPILPTTGSLSLLPHQSQEFSAIAANAREGTAGGHGGFFTHWWVDAGWYAIPSSTPQNWSNGVGNWFPDPKRFPDGMGPTFQRAMGQGLKSLLWSEPERVMPGTELYEQHRDWLIAPPAGSADINGYLLDFGNPDAWAWAVQHFDRIIMSQGAPGQDLDVFRQDFNMDPLDYWNSVDKPGRIGMTQVKHVTGHLAFWDELRRRHPRLWIDSCASGGRRNDLETMRRSVPLDRSDYQFEPTGQQCQTYGISFWLPYYGTGVGPQSTNHGAYGPGQYVVRSSIAPCYTSSVDARTATAADWDLLRSMNEQFVRIKDDLVYSDFYPLTEYSLDDDVWMAMQFDRPAAGSGVVLAFRRPKATATTMQLTLQGLSGGAMYRVDDFDRSGTELVAGSTLLQQGLALSLPDAPGSAIVQYTRQATTTSPAS